MPSSRGLRVAAIVSALQGLALVGYSLYLLVQAIRLGVTGPAEVSNVPAVVLEIFIFGSFGVALLWAGWGLWKSRRWARAPVVVAQAIAVVIAVPLISAEGTIERVVGIVTLIAVVACSFGLLHPRSTAELNAE